MLAELGRAKTSIVGLVMPIQEPTNIPLLARVRQLGVPLGILDRKIGVVPEIVDPLSES